MPYLKEDEMNLSWSLGLTEAGNMGHIVPGHEIMLTKVQNIFYNVTCHSGSNIYRVLLP